LKNKKLKKFNHAFLIILLAFLLFVVIYLNASLFNRNLYPQFSYTTGVNRSGYVEYESMNNKINSTCFQNINFDELNANPVNYEKKATMTVNHSHKMSEDQSVAVDFSTIQNTQTLNNYQSENQGSINQFSATYYNNISSQALNNDLQTFNQLARYKNKSKRSTILNTQNDSIHPSQGFNSVISDLGFPVGLTAENNSFIKSSVSDPGDPGGPPVDNPIPVPDGCNYLIILAAVYAGWRKCFCNYNCET